MLSDEIDEEKRGTKVPRTRRRKSQPARWGAGWSSDRSSFRGIDRSSVDRPSLVDARPCGTRGHRTPRAEVGRADVGIKSRRNRRRKERHVCRTMNAAERLMLFIVRIIWMDMKKEKNHTRN